MMSCYKLRSILVNKNKLYILKIISFSLTNPFLGFTGEGYIAFWKIRIVKKTHLEKKSSENRIMNHKECSALTLQKIHIFDTSKTI